ncbi:bacterial low temperature requirement A protein-domain-containing protein [Fusarium flagelliforme]|uniref:bacterial low temperature requirement A protein-domain-containing protein n=1 Tax=Fusarium flagelliforme TaxID=2675880 RepID=UPI001E8EE9F1|nr:bacterial low temperature requirement A protein-domain-containing protein [Fusarium flagelliforme]KAH7197126.1 bacterial low temperature requirement A protein-domain-containing protein [Fusarium flagelliforme]
MSFIPSARRRRPQEFTLPNGKRVIASLPEDVNELREKHGDLCDTQIEIIIHGSPEHHNYLKETRDHHESRRDHFRRKHGPAFDEWEDMQSQLDLVNSHMERLSTSTSGLNANFDKFGYGAELRTYDDDEPAPGVDSSSMSTSDTLSVGSGGGQPRLGETIKLFKKPVIKQWFHKGLLWRASDNTEIMAIELFFDLLYVGIIHVNGEHVWAEPTGKELLRFAITFIMSWKIWSDITLILSWFETDDVFTRLEILFEIACLLGFSTNMTYAFYEGEHNTYTMLVSFYVAARFRGIVHFLYTAYLLPMVRGVMICQAINIIVPATIWIASIHVEMPSRLGLIWVAIALDMCGQSILTGLFQWGRTTSQPKRFARYLSGLFEFFPAVNIEHRVERTNAFVSLVFGYSVMGPMFQSHGGYTVDVFLGKAILGLCQAFVFNWIYFDVDGSNIDVHAIRRAVYTSSIWHYAHLPFIMGYILASAGLSKLVLVADTPSANPEHLTDHYIERAEPEIANGIRYFYCHGLAIALLFMGVISACHGHRHPSTRRLSKKTRLANRALVCLILFCLPLAKSLNSLNLVSITLALTTWVLLLELFGKSCRNDPFIGEKQGCSVRYKCKCSKKDLENANLDEKPKTASAEVLELGPREKTAVADVQD